MALTRKQRRGSLIATGAVILALCGGSRSLRAPKTRSSFSIRPQMSSKRTSAAGQRFRLGGIVKEDSVDRSAGSLVKFVVTDTADTLNVVFEGVLPDLFREGQGVVAEGKLNAEGTFVADTVLAKHDETYMPKEVADALKEKGLWRHETATE